MSASGKTNYMKKKRHQNPLKRQSVVLTLKKIKNKKSIVVRV